MSEISLLFAVEAEQYLLAGMVNEAVDLCRRGLKIYPDYPSALNILNRAEKILQNQASNEDPEKIDLNIYQEFEENTVSDANLSVSDLSEDLNANSENDLSSKNVTFDVGSSNTFSEEFYGENKDISEINSLLDLQFGDTIILKEIPENENVRITKAESNIIDYKNLKSSNIELISGLSRYINHKNKKLFISQKSSSKNSADKYKHQFELKNLISSLESAQPIKPEKIIISEKNKSTVMVSDTIATILIQQGAYEEAKKTYLELIKKYPQKSDFYNQKISEIDSKSD